MDLWVDRELKSKLTDARAHDEQIFGRTDLKPESITRTLELAEQVSQQEQDRETNLNTRGAAVATVAGLVVTVSGAVTKSLFTQRPEWTDWTKIVTLGLFVAALFLVASSMFMAVVWVLRPGRGARTRNYLGETLMGLWVHEREGLLKANKDRTDLLCLDRALRTVPEWHIRNRQKARWLRRSWMFLLGGVLLIALAAVFLLVHLLGIQGSAGPEGPATKIPTWWELGLFVLLLACLAWGALKSDFPLFAARREEQPADDAAERSKTKKRYIRKKKRDAQREEKEEREEREEIKKIAEELRRSADRVVADCRWLDDGFNCSLTIAGEEGEVVPTVAEHAVSMHGCEDTRDLERRVRRILEPEHGTSRDSRLPKEQQSG